MHTTELYDGVYDFSGRWEEPPIVPPPPVCDTCVEVIRVSWLRMLKLIRTEGPDGVIVDSGTFVSYGLPPAGYRNIDYRLDPPQTERLMYEVWSGGQQIGYALDADHGIHNCEGLDNGEVCPVRPFRPSARHLGLLGPYRGGRLA
jgi:hypothetical protein